MNFCVHAAFHIAAKSFDVLLIVVFIMNVTL